jgi:hypothetical protein
MSDFNTVQFRDASSVVRAYENRGVPAFCIRNKNQLLFVYKGDDLEEGKNLLTEYMDLLQKSESAGIYTLCVYEEFKGGRITNKTEYDGSFNFRFTDTISINQTKHPFANELTALREEVKLLHEKMEAKEEEEEESTDTMGSIAKLLDNPMIAGVVGAIFEKVMDSLTKKPVDQIQNEANTQNLKAVSGVEVESEVFYAYEILCKSRKDFPELFKKLALLAQKKPKQFGIYCTMLKTMIV